MFRHAALCLVVAACLVTQACSKAEPGAGAASDHDQVNPAPAAGQQAAGLPDLPDAIRQRVATAPAVKTSAARTAHAELIELYEPAGWGPLWVGADGRPAPQAREALTVLARAADDGLDPAHYDVERLTSLREKLEAPGTRSAALAAELDVALSTSVLRYFRHLHLGRIDPRTIGFRIVVPVEGHDFVPLVREAATNRRVAETAAALAPQLAQYRRLREALVRYRALSADTTLQPPPESGVVRPGDRYEHLGALHRWLVALGDLPEAAPPPRPGDLYDGPYVEAVARFQARHGLAADGVIGRSTSAALRVPLAWRTRQIELALERLRWLPDLTGRVVALNIPMFRLWAWDQVSPYTGPALSMRAVVGRAMSTQTPVFVEEMRGVVFRPYWHVPRSILLNEILPAVARDPSYLSRHDMEVVAGPGDDARPVPVSAAALADLRRGRLRLRQRPGPHNSLGLIKFDFPNDQNVYMHGTPAKELFSRTRRDFSHGCVRLEHPAEMAEWVLGREPGWSRERIDAAMAAGPTRYVALSEPIRVILYYLTAVVMTDGSVHFADDIYRHDARLDRALAGAKRAGGS
ncbi:MAG TPA: L,D-transpeptidase family protein [Vicinamibacterales bacterium]